MQKKPELVAPAGTPAALETALESGADAVYAGFQDATNARHFPGLNFSPDEMAEGVRIAHEKGRKLYATINTFPESGKTALWQEAVDAAAACGVDALILADPGLCAYAAKHHPGLRRHLSVQASATTPEAISFFREEFGIARVILPRALSLKEIETIIAATDVEIEVFVFGSLCIMAEGHCALSGEACGISPNRAGACSPASAAHLEEKDGKTSFYLGPFLLNRFSASENPGYPTVCKGRYLVNGTPSYALEIPESLDAGPVLRQLMEMGVAAFKIEGRQRGRAYVKQATAAFRKAIDTLETTDLSGIAEGGRTTTGAYLPEKQR